MEITQKVDVVILGAGITGLSVAMPLKKGNKTFLILEKTDRVGGQIHTRCEKGFTYETGPNTGTISHPEVSDIFEFASKYCHIEVACEAAKARWIWKGRKFHSLPSNLIDGIKTPLFTTYDKFRLLGEPFRSRGKNPNESVGALAERRLGKSFVDYAVDPFVGGIYAANPYHLTTKFALPKLYNLEQDFGSFIRGAIKKARIPKTQREKLATKEVFSVEGGMSSLVEALGKIYSEIDAVRLNVKSIKLDYQSDRNWIVDYIDGEGIEQRIACKDIVSTLPAYELPLLFDFAPQIDLKDLLSLKYAPMIEVVVGFDHWAGMNIKAFGGLVPSVEKRKILGILFPSSCFKNRGPYTDSALFNIFMGGMRDGATLYPLSDEEIIKIGLSELYDMLRLDNKIKPDLVRIFRHPRAIPQYDKSMEERWLKIHAIENLYKGLHLCGAVKDGIGMSHRIAQGVNMGHLLA